MRDTYAKKVRDNKRIRSGSGGQTTQKWPFFDMMNFLNDLVKTRSTFCTLESRVHETIDDNYEQDTINSQETPNMSDDNENEIALGAFSQPSKKRRTVNNSVDRAILRELENQRPPNDTCASFGQFVGSALRDMEGRRRIMTMSKISNIIFEASNCGSDSSTHSQMNSSHHNASMIIESHASSASPQGSSASLVKNIETFYDNHHPFLRGNFTS